MEGGSGYFTEIHNLLKKMENLISHQDKMNDH